MAVPIGNNNDVEFVSRSGKFIINIGKINLDTPPVSIDIGVSPKDIEKIIGKDFFASCRVTISGDEGVEMDYVICSCKYIIFVDNNNDYNYAVVIDMPDIGIIQLSTTSETSTRWNVSL